MAAALGYMQTHANERLMRRAVASTPGLLVNAAAWASLAVLWWMASPPAAMAGLAGQLRDPDGLDPLVGGLAESVAWMLVAWLCLHSTLAVTRLAPGRIGATAGALADRWTPQTLRAALAVTLSVAALAAVSPSAQAAHSAPRPATAAGVGSPAGAVSAAAPTASDTLLERPAADLAPQVAASSAASLLDRPSAGATAREVPDKPWTPQRPAPRPVDASTVTGRVRPELSTPEDVVVRRGDTLWSIAARHLGATASPHAVDTEWRRWWHANRHTVGRDPSRLRPGQLLNPPTPSTPFAGEHRRAG